MVNVQTLARMTYAVRQDAVVREQIARGEFGSETLTAEEKRVLSAMAKRIRDGQPLPKHLRVSSALYWK